MFDIVTCQSENMCGCGVTVHGLGVTLSVVESRVVTVLRQGVRKQVTGFWILAL